ncbi:IS110 family transposase [Phototrophicus methaneseepsis]|uniref:IS110 family transposase n=1 Tax=Phototrophicus methaneseepsis TaxID=2710758 RepID=A0A7S8E7E0_9CHLR|nr:transposase [Phototrophicus methaneseepsis]QPC81668.1 IS110 family transposase [Phototrophicus methaneseepsis]
MDDLKQDYQRVKNRIEAQRSSPHVLKQLKQQKRFFEGQMAQTMQLIREHVKRSPDLKRQHDLLTTIPGLGDMTAYRLIAELGDMRRFNNVREIVAYVGLNRRHHQSGKKRTSRGISKTGRPSVRAALYMPAVVAKIHNPILKAFAARLEARGLAPKQIIVAVMRKLLHLAYGILKSGNAFDPNYADKLAFAA